MYRKFWEAGYRVFGLFGANSKGQCACGNPDCKAAYKHPLTRSWQHTPLWSTEQLETMEVTGQFKTGYGVLVRGMLVIDIDARNGGVSSFEKLSGNVPEIAGAGLIVETGSGNGSKHLYFKLPENLALSAHLQNYKGIDFKSSGFVVGPESMHISGNRYKVLVGSPDDIDEAPQALIDLLRKPEKHRAEIDGRTIDVSHRDIADMLRHIDPDTDHETWIRIGMAIHHSTGGTGFAIWNGWSEQGQKYPNEDNLAKRWHSFGKSANPVTMGTLVHHAEQGGWKWPVTFETNEDIEEETTNSIDISNIDLRRPPGFVGTVTQWINDQSRYDRENLSVAAALTTIGNVIGLRYADELGDVTSNVFAFCVAASGTGKESVLQSVIQIHKLVGINKALYSNIKSEQEIVRNLTRNQASLYVMDEIGIFLKKIKTAQDRGGASYLEGVIGILMSAYSKANGYMPLSGDVREDVRKSILLEIGQYDRRLDNGPDPKIQRMRDEAEAALQTLDDGLEKPFLSLIGFTTPVTFENLVTYEAAANGFIGRALIFNERSDVPREKKRFKKRPMPEDLSVSLQQLYMSGHYDVSPGKIENRGPRTMIPTTKDAESMLEHAMDVMHAHAEDHQEKSGMSSLFLRSKELIAKVSFILAAPSGLRTAEHVRWAYALVLRDVEEKTNLVVGNERIKDSPKEALYATLKNIISGDDGETLGVIFNKLRKFKHEDIERCLDEMVKKGTATLEETIHPRRKIKVRRYKKK